jgi:molybdate transport system permease protein
VTGWTTEELQIVWLSLKVAGVATLGVAIPAIATAWVLARTRFWGRGLLNVLVHLPLVVPPVVIGYLLLRMFGRRGPVGAWLEHYLGLQFSFRWTGAALAAGVMAFPLVVRTVRLGIENVDQRLEEAAETLGASPVWTFVTVTLPLALPGLVAGLIIGFAKALGEFGATITFVSNIPGETQTLALAIFTQLERPGGDIAAMRLVWLSIGISVIALIASGRLAEASGGRGREFEDDAVVAAETGSRSARAGPGLTALVARRDRERPY